jgi:hypothetical protein
VEFNRRGDYVAASGELKATARKIRTYAGHDPELGAIIDGLLREAEVFGHAMFEEDRKVHYAMSAHAMQSRDVMGKAKRGGA